MKSSLGALVLIVAAVAGLILLFSPKKTGASTTGASTTVLPSGASADIVTTDPYGFVAPSTTTEASSESQASGISPGPTETLQQAAESSGVATVSSDSLAALGIQSVTTGPSDLAEVTSGGNANSPPTFGPAGAPLTPGTWASKSTDQFYTVAIVGYNQDGSPILAASPLGNLGVYGGAYSSYSALLNDIASGAYAAASAQRHEAFLEQRRGS